MRYRCRSVGLFSVAEKYTVRVFFVDAHHGAFAKVIDEPVTGGELADQLAVKAIQIQMCVAVAGRCPYELMGLSGRSTRHSNQSRYCWFR